MHKTQKSEKIIYFNCLDIRQYLINFFYMAPFLGQSSSFKVITSNWESSLDFPAQFVIFFLKFDLKTLFPNLTIALELMPLSKNIASGDQRVFRIRLLFHYVAARKSIRGRFSGSQEMGSGIQFPSKNINLLCCVISFETLKL